MSVIGCLSRESNIQKKGHCKVASSEWNLKCPVLHDHLQEISKKYAIKISGAFSREYISATGFSGFFVIQSGSSTSAVT